MRVNPLIAFAINLAFPKPREQNVAVAEPELADSPVITMLKRKAGAVVVVLGRRESGKTVVAYRLAEGMGRKVYAVSPEQCPPPGVTELKMEQLEAEPPPFSTLVLDDLPVYASSHDYGDAFVKNLERMIPVVRHKRKLILIFCTQLASLADKYALDADVVIFKPPSLLYQDLERISVKKWQDSLAPIWEGKSDMWVKKHCFILSHSWKGLVSVDKPHSFTEEDRV